jgi:pyruvate/2-oxoglutarate dehydrogenase complex dihydrolipoamide acyltransferase (E2) component
MPSNSPRPRHDRRDASHASTRPALRAGRLAAVGAALLCTLLSACGGSAAAPSGSPDVADNALKFSRCMREHGIKDFPDPAISGGKVTLKFTAKPGEPGSASPRTLEAAQNACRHFQAASQPKLSPQEKVAREEAVLKFASCMREHGIDVHASAGQGGILMKIDGGRGASGPNPESPGFQAAQKACQGQFPITGAGPPTTVKGAGPTSGASKGAGGGTTLSLSG